jgi:hypothetical protein
MIHQQQQAAFNVGTLGAFRVIIGWFETHQFSRCYMALLSGA